MQNMSHTVTESYGGVLFWLDDALTVALAAVFVFIFIIILIDIQYVYFVVCNFLFIDLW